VSIVLPCDLIQYIFKLCIEKDCLFLFKLSENVLKMLEYSEEEMAMLILDCLKLHFEKEKVPLINKSDYKYLKIYNNENFITILNLIKDYLNEENLYLLVDKYSFQFDKISSRYEFINFKIIEFICRLNKHVILNDPYFQVHLINYNNIEMMKEISTNEFFRWDKNCIGCACKNNNFEFLKFLISEGCEVNDFSFVYCVQNQNLEMLEFLYSLNTKLNNSDEEYNCLYYSIRTKNMKILEWLISSFNNILNINSYCLSHLYLEAVFSYNLDALKILNFQFRNRNSEQVKNNKSIYLMKCLNNQEIKDWILENI
jgi:hypothetical protein